MNTNMTPEGIAEAVIAGLRADREIDRSMSAELHASHHEFLRILIEREALRVERRRKFETSMIGSLVIAFIAALGWLGMLVIEGFKHYIHTNGSGP
jgi:hypothetical protein